MAATETAATGGEDDRFRALVVRTTDDGPHAELETVAGSELPDGDVTIAVEYSSLNYKDGLAVTGAGRIVRSYPMVPGIDLTGIVTASDSERFAVGDAVILNGWGVGERHWGGFAQRARVRSEWLVPRPAGLGAVEAMAIGTAGLAAMMCVLAIEDADVASGDGPVVVTGAAGGVGSVAVAVLNHLGYDVAAVTGRPEQHAYLTSLGASTLLARADMAAPPRPLESERWAAAVDTVGSTTLARVLAETRYGGVVAACGLAGGSDLPTTVMPFILRGVRLQGVDTVMAPPDVRTRAWDRLVTDLPRPVLATMTEVVPLERVLALAPAIVSGRVRGRIVVDPNA